MNVELIAERFKCEDMATLLSHRENKMAGWSFATADSSPISRLCEKLQAHLPLQHSSFSIQGTVRSCPDFFSYLLLVIISFAIPCGFRNTNSHDYRERGKVKTP